MEKLGRFFMKIIHLLCPERAKLLTQGGIFFRESPIWGHGTGSWASLIIRHNEFYLEPDLQSHIPNPHNEWTHVATQWGTVGVLITVFWMIMPLGIALQMGFDFKHKISLLCLTVGLLLGGMSDTVLLFSVTRDFYTFTLSAVLASGWRQVSHHRERFPRF
jgi:O-antigen ligase